VPSSRLVTQVASYIRQVVMGKRAKVKG